MENKFLISNDLNTELEDSGFKTESTNDFYDNLNMINENHHINEEKQKKLNLLLKKEKSILLNRNNLIQKKEFYEVKNGIELISHNLNNFFSIKLKKYNKKYD